MRQECKTPSATEAYGARNSKGLSHLRHFILAFSSKFPYRCIAFIISSFILYPSSFTGLPAEAVLGASKAELQAKLGAPKALAFDYYDDEYQFNGWRLKVRYNRKSQRVVWLSAFLPRNDFLSQSKLPNGGRLNELAGRFASEPVKYQQEMNTMRYYSYRNYIRWIYLRVKEIEIELILDETSYNLLH